MNKNRNSEKEDLQNELISLKNKANRLASMHSSLSDYYSYINNISSSLVIFLSVLLISLTFASNEIISSTLKIPFDTQRLLIGLASVLIFSIELILLGFNLKDKSASHREAVRFYFKIMNQIRLWLETDVIITTEMVEEIRDEYGRTEALPKIPEAVFLRLKQHHLRKIAVSRELDSAPFESLRTIKRLLKGKTKNTINNE